MVIVGIITDFGKRGQHYIAEMKGVALQINPHLQIIDVSHAITSFSIIEAAYVLYSVYSSFPKGTIFVCVVDPGVGSERDIVAVKTNDDYIFIGPDNGIFSHLSLNNLIELIVTITESEFYYKPFIDSITGSNNSDHLDFLPNIDPYKISSTFHGRDIMMPIAAHMSKGLDILSVGIPKEEVIVLQGFEPEFFEAEQKLKAQIQYIDNFGNIITNIPINEFHLLTYNKYSKFRLIYLDTVVELKLVPYFAENQTDELLLIEGSSGFLEICQNQRKASSTIKAQVGDDFQIEFLGAIFSEFTK